MLNERCVIAPIPPPQERLDAVSRGMQGGQNPEQHLARLRALQQEAEAFRPTMEEVEGANQAIQGAMVFDNRHTAYTMEVGGVGSPCLNRLN